MPPETFDPIAFAYQNTRGVPMYMNFEYKLNWVTPMTIIDLLLNIIGILIFIQIPIFYFKNKKKIKNIGLRLDILQAFLLMQIWNIWMLIGEFLMFKIPFTGIFTNYCANNNPQVLMRLTVFFFYWTHYSAQLFTLLFCVLRVAILYSNSNKEKEKLFYYLIPPFIIFPFLASVPHLLTEGLCLQMEQPFPFGAILIISKFFEDNLVLCAVGNFALTAIVTFTIIGLNIAMFFKIRKRKKLSVAAQSQSTQNQKAAKTLTGTMIVMLTPLIVYLFLTALEIIQTDYFVYVLYCQISIFYFKNKQKIKKIGLRLDVFQSFLLMQIWNIWMVIGEFLMFKIPFTGIFTNYCANNNPQIFLRFTVFSFYWAHYSSQLFTLLFCALRVAILYSNSTEEKEKLFYYLIPPFIIFPFLASLPHLVTEGRCLQMEQPFPFGAIIIISEFFENNVVLSALGRFVLTAIVTFTIIGLNIAMFWKIWKRKKLSVAGQSTQNQKVSRTLTGTMIIMLTPLIAYLFVSALEIIPTDYFVYILYCGDIAGDIRVHTVTCYFYFTHPVFKKHGMIRKITVAQKVTSQSEHFWHYLEDDFFLRVLWKITSNIANQLDKVILELWSIAVNSSDFDHFRLRSAVLEIDPCSIPTSWRLKGICHSADPSDVVYSHF